MPVALFMIVNTFLFPCGVRIAARFMLKLDSNKYDTCNTWLKYHAKY